MATMPLEIPTPENPYVTEQAVNQILDLRYSDVTHLALPAEAGHAFSVEMCIAGTDCVVDLWPHSNRGPNFRVLVDGANGLEEIAPPAPTTYKGWVRGLDDAVVVGSFVDGKLTASIYLPDGARYTVEPVPAELQPEAGMHVIYEELAVAPTDDTCGGAPYPDDLIDEVHAGDDAGAGGLEGGLVVAEIACDADHEFFLDSGSSEATAIADIENIIANVETQYEEQLGILYEISTIIVRSNPADPYSDTVSPGGLLDEFDAHWSSTHDDIPRDVAHLFTGRNLSGGIIGIARRTTICSLTAGYGLSENIGGAFNRQVDLVAHELGHNWSAGHCNTTGERNFYDNCCGGDPAPNDDSYTMCSSLGAQVNNIFCPPTAAEIASYRDTRPCLSVPPAETSIPIFDDFPSTTLDSAVWSTVGNVTVSTEATGEPSAPFSTRILGSSELRTGIVNTTGLCGIQIDYFWQAGAGTIAPDAGEDLVVEYRADSGGWIEVARHLGGQGSGAFAFGTVMLDDTAVHETFQARFRMTNGGTADGFFVDDIEITANERVNITQNPTGTTVCPGESAMFSVTATGTGPLSYQWQKNAIPIAGATMSTYMISGIVPSDAGMYRCVVNNSCSSQTSGQANLTVRTLPAITTQPAAMTEVAQGGTFSLLSGASGSGPLTFQWQLNGEDIPDATGFFVFDTAADCADQGVYRLTATNPCGTAISNEAVVIVTGCETAAMLGDCDSDEDVDLVDFGSFQLCFTGPGGSLAPGCECADFDEDGDIDLVDFGQFQLAFTGPL